ncbi:glycosyltransferase family 4 protein [Micromonospora sp. NPDC048871]|uniref:glycosyltransferase family 4 protein n=1 Tax=unclassified Micromonospora TaxID=2617518 RepID=UPI002E121781|nr:glycosyltransferase family 4 protein [Micromonospora sp. NBC_01739]
MTTLRIGGRTATATDRSHRPTLISRAQFPAQSGPATPPRGHRILMLSWEFPPVLVGGLGRHVHALSVALVAAGHEVTVVTRHAEGAPLEEYVDGVRVVRAAEDPVTFPLATESLLAWTMAFNHTLTRAALRAAQTGGYDVIHAHDWLVAHTAMTLRDHLDLPLVSTIHATEAGRHQGWLPGEMNRTIHGVEQWLGSESTRVVVCSGYMREEVTGLFGVPAGRVDVVPNGVEPHRWRVPASAVAQARARFAGEGPLVTFAGRLVYEKGVQHLLAGLPRLRERHPGLRAVIVGDGPYRGELEADVHRLGLADTVSLPGFLGGTDLPAVMAASDCFAVPSIYEPFGMVALEGAAAGAPLAVAETGGLAEIVEPGVTGVTFRPHDPQALTDAVHGLLADPEHARTLARRARVMVHEQYGWAAIASRTASAYASAIAQAPTVAAERAAQQMAHGRPRPSVPEGNLLAAAGLR